MVLHHDPHKGLSSFTACEQNRRRMMFSFSGPGAETPSLFSGVSRSFVSARGGFLWHGGGYPLDTWFQRVCSLCHLLSHHLYSSLYDCQALRPSPTHLQQVKLAAGSKWLLPGQFWFNFSLAGPQWLLTCLVWSLAGQTWHTFQLHFISIVLFRHSAN